MEMNLKLVLGIRYYPGRRTRLNYSGQMTAELKRLVVFAMRQYGNPRRVRHLSFLHHQAANVAT